MVEVEHKIRRPINVWKSYEGWRKTVEICWGILEECQGKGNKYEVYGWRIPNLSRGVKEIKYFYAGENWWAEKEMNVAL